jgi:quinolinate synthase
MGSDGVISEIDRLRREKGAVILAHNYQPPGVQDIADFVGDSLDLSRRAAELDCGTIVFCGVDFMAETAKILSPGKTVLIPRSDATCPMAAMIEPEDVRRLRAEHPGAAVVAYVNTTAAVKAECDACCTSANAVEVVESLPQDEIVFVPDRNLASWVQERTSKRIVPWDGFCYVHERIRTDEVMHARLALPKSVFTAHPECVRSVRELADEVLSTNGMVRFARSSPAKELLVGTEAGLLYRLQKENRDKRFYSAGRAVFCKNMKLTRLEDVLRALRENTYEVSVQEQIAKRARAALEAMLAAV